METKTEKASDSIFGPTSQFVNNSHRLFLDDVRGELQKAPAASVRISFRAVGARAQANTSCLNFHLVLPVRYPVAYTEIVMAIIRHKIRRLRYEKQFGLADVLPTHIVTPAFPAEQLCLSKIQRFLGFSMSC